MVFGKLVGLSRKAALPTEAPIVEQPPPVVATPKQGGQKAGSSPKHGTLTVNEFVARTKKCREKGLEPTKPELIAYARYLGIDPIGDGDLMWIADEALNAPLPAEWTEHHDSAERVFYYNVQTHASSWTHPLEQLHRDTYKNIVQFRNGNASKEDQTRELEKWRQRCEDSERDAHKELQAWTEHTDDQGTKFYYNSELQRSVWTDPRPARCHTLYLQMKALRSLSKACGYPYAAREPETIKSELGRAAARMEESSRTSNKMPPDPMRSTTNKMPVDPMRGTRQVHHSADVMRSTRTGMDGFAKSTKTTVDPMLKTLDGGFDSTMTGFGAAAPLPWKASKKAVDKDAGSDTDGFLSGAECGLSDKEQRRRKKKGRKAAKEDHHSESGGEGGPTGMLSELPGGDSGLDSLPMIGRGKGRLTTPPADGLSTVGRARVRAGIKLQPLG